MPRRADNPGMPRCGETPGPLLCWRVQVVFNTSLTGYQEIMTDPSYKGQFVVFTCPHIGNVGINMGASAAAARRRARHEVPLP